MSKINMGKISLNILFNEEIAEKSDALVLGVGLDKHLGQNGRNLNEKTGGAIDKAIDSYKFTGKLSETVVISAPHNVKYKHIILIGLGDNNELSEINAQSIGGKIFTALCSVKAANAQIVFDDSSNSSLLAANAAYGAVLRSYRFDKYKTKVEDDERPTLENLSFSLSQVKDAEALYNKLESVAKGVFLARDVVTEPPNVLYPESYAKIIKDELSSDGVTVKILGEKQLSKLGMGALLGVGQGSVRESQVVVMEWKGDKKSKDAPIAFVGKGVTFDTGGISIKPSNGMEDMKYDMGGSASVVGLMKALASRKAKVNAIGVVGLVENMPDGIAQRPSDVVTSMSGQTIAVLNTDAEGRLVLADALWYCQETYKPHTVINLATLTGAIVIALANQNAGIFSNDDTLAEQLSAAGAITDEKVWRLPLSKEYDKMIDSEIADMQNISNGRGAGSITAAQFLQRFIQEGVKWTHIDIAGMAWADKELDVCPKGATGYGVRLLDRLVADNYEAK